MAEPPHITISDYGTLPQLVRRCFDAAIAGQGGLDNTVYAIEGFCGRKHRLFLHNLVAALPDPRYIEIGLFKGATFCAALWQNRVRALGVDNWSEYGGPANAAAFYRNLAACRGPRARINLVEADFRTAPLAAFGRFNIGFYDGSHTEADQYDGARAILDVLDDTAILMIDDWNWTGVRQGTMRALSDSGRHTSLAIDLRTTTNDTTVEGAGFGGGSDWHNGVFVAVVSR